MSNSIPFESRLAALTPHLQTKAAILANASPDHDADDLFQTMVLKIMERVAGDPSFLDREDWQIIQFAEWRAKHAAESARTYTRYVEPERYLSDGEGEEISLLELVASDAPNPEDAYIETEELERLAGRILALTPENQRVVAMLYKGYSQVEIAEALGVSKAAVTQRKATIARALVN